MYMIIYDVETGKYLVMHYGEYLFAPSGVRWQPVVHVSSEALGMEIAATLPHPIVESVYSVEDEKWLDTVKLPEAADLFQGTNV
jgi:hypothetical protein